ncbi:MAG: putative transposase [Mycobacterium sp.]|nr:putative transposase [Mycobacterium sp.]
MNRHTAYRWFREGMLPVPAERVGPLMQVRTAPADDGAAGGGVVKPKRDGTPSLSRYVDVGADFEAHRVVVESVSVLFDPYDGDADCYAQTGSPGKALPAGWVVTAAKFEVQWPTEPARAALVCSQFRGTTQSVQWGPGSGEGRPGRESR